MDTKPKSKEDSMQEIRGNVLIWFYGAILQLVDRPQDNILFSLFLTENFGRCGGLDSN